MGSEQGSRRPSSLLVTGGAGFLGRDVVALLAERHYSQVSAPRKREYDLTKAEAVAACVREVRPEAIVHLAAVVGGLGLIGTGRGSSFTTT